MAETISSNAPKIAVAGVSGYAGAELARLLLHHPRLGVHPVFYGRAGEASSMTLTDLHPQLATHNGPVRSGASLLLGRPYAARGVDLLFLALPHEQSREYAPEALARDIRVVDLSGAWRLQSDELRAVYSLTDADPSQAAKLQAEAIFGSPELHRERIATARLSSQSRLLFHIAHPRARAAPARRLDRCRPRHRLRQQSPASAARARQPPRRPTSCTRPTICPPTTSSAIATRASCLNNCKLTRAQIQFTPHLLPIPRGILSTIYVRLRSESTPDALASTFSDFHRDSPMVRLHRSPALPEIQHVVRTNYCDLGFELAPDGKRLVIVSCLDNLLKGAAGQAVQNMNLMLGFAEEEGLL